MVTVEYLFNALIPSFMHFVANILDIMKYLFCFTFCFYSTKQ